MTITVFINGFRSDPETRRLMGLAFELPRVTLRLSDRNDQTVQLIAERIIDPERLCDHALASLRAPMRV